LSRLRRRHASRCPARGVVRRGRRRRENRADALGATTQGVSGGPRGAGRWGGRSAPLAGQQACALWAAVEPLSALQHRASEALGIRGARRDPGARGAGGLAAPLVSVLWPLVLAGKPRGTYERVVRTGARAARRGERAGLLI